MPLQAMVPPFTGQALHKPHKARVQDPDRSLAHPHEVITVGRAGPCPAKTIVLSVNPSNQLHITKSREIMVYAQDPGQLEVCA